MQNELKAGNLIVNELGDLILLTTDAHYLSGEFSGIVLRMRGTRNEMPVMQLTKAVEWAGKIVRSVGHVDDFLRDLDKIDRTPAEKPDSMLTDAERIERLEAKLVALRTGTVGPGIAENQPL